ncbi:MAG: DUF2333 family protein [Rhodospirillaceae bacterium]|nr:DUF2333 family protein [Rhodospirillaceae bacterium]
MSDFLRDTADRLRSSWQAVRDRLTGAVPSTGDDADHKYLPWIVAVIFVLVVVYYPVGMLLNNRIADDLDVKPAPAFDVQGGSKAVAVAATIVARDADQWLPNAPFWHPAAALDNAPNFQLGTIYAVSRFVLEVGDYLGRVRGSSAIDANLDRAVGLLKYDGTTWYWGQGNIIPKPKAESQYREAVEHLAAYNREVGAGTSTYDKRADNLIAFLDRVAADLGSASAELDARAQEGGGYLNFHADDVFYNTKGKLYGYYVILNALGEDFAVVIKEKQASGIYADMLTSLRTAAGMDPLIVVNGDPDALTMPSHLRALGFPLLRARIQMRELGDILQK